MIESGEDQGRDLSGLVVTLRSYPHSNEAVTEAVGPRCGRELTVAMPVTVGLLLPGPVLTREPCLQAAFEGRNQQEVRK